MLLTLSTILLVTCLSIQAYKGRKKYSFSFGWSYISRERIFIRGKNKVTLLGMVHIAKPRFYQSILKSYKDSDCLTLSEGVKDKKKLCPAKLDYQYIANLLDLQAQPKKMKLGRTVNCDQDISELSTQAISTINFVCKLIESFKKSDSKEFNKLCLDIDKHPVTGDLLLNSRNKKLIKGIDKRLAKEKNILIPWGAAHLPEIEEHLLKKGFKIKKTKYRVVMDYPALIVPLIRLLYKSCKKESK